jgi:glyoxylase-like metal-dependent hydrolase (beta-lactamase superfamily II)
MVIAPGIHLFEGDYVRQTGLFYRGIGSSNFLVFPGNPQFQIDSGMDRGPHRQRVQQQMADASVDPGLSHLVLLSHAHPDHFMQAKRTADRQKAILLHEDAEPFIRNDDFFLASYMNFPDLMLPEILPMPEFIFRRTFAFSGFSFRYLKAREFFHENEILPLPVRVIPILLPSHCPGHCGFYLPHRELLYSADLFDLRTARGLMLGNAFSSFRHAFSDLDKLADLPISILVPGHGSPVTGRKAIKELLARVRTGTTAYLENLELLLREHPQTLTELRIKLFPNCNFYNKSHRAIIIYNSLMHLLKEKRVNFTCLKQRAIWFPV